MMTKLQLSQKSNALPFVLNDEMIFQNHNPKNS